MKELRKGTNSTLERAKNNGKYDSELTNAEKKMIQQEEKELAELEKNEKEGFAI